jgi:zinc protease
MTRTWLMTLLAAIAVGRAMAADVPGADRIETMTLDNGLKIIVWPDHDIPNVVIYNWVRVGSRNEYPGITGLAHFFEHMMFNGTSTRAPGEFDRVMEAAGGSNNAFTSDDVTVYQDWMPSSALQTILDLEGDRLANLSFDPEVVESERGVVSSERRLNVEDKNSNRLMEQVEATAYLAHPYGNPTIGWPSDIESWRIEDLKRFFQTYYAPNNCTLIVTGAVEPQEFFRLAERSLGGLVRQPPPDPVRTQEPEQNGERRLRLIAPAQTPILEVAYHSLRAADVAGPALDLMLRILAGGESSRLHRALVEEQKVAVEIDYYWHEGLDPGLTWFFLTLPAGADPENAQRALDAELERFIEQGPTPQELAKARNLALTDFWRSLATIDGRAMALGMYEVLRGDFRLLFAAPRAYDAVTQDDMRSLAAKILRRGNRTLGLLDAASGDVIGAPGEAAQHGEET